MTVLANRNVGSKNPNVSMMTDHDKPDLQVSFPDFTVAAYAKELNIAKPSEGNIK